MTKGLYPFLLTGFLIIPFVASPLEQHVHSFLEMIPLMAGSFVAVRHWPQLLALFGLGTAPARFSIVWKSQPLPLVYIVTVLVAALLFELLPYLEELCRGLIAWKNSENHRAVNPWLRS
jgi:hypothetical protein